MTDIYANEFPAPTYAKDGDKTIFTRKQAIALLKAIGYSDFADMSNDDIGGDLCSSGIIHDESFGGIIADPGDASDDARKASAMEKLLAATPAEVLKLAMRSKLPKILKIEDRPRFKVLSADTFAVSYVVREEKHDYVFDRVIVPPEEITKLFADHVVEAHDGILFTVKGVSNGEELSALVRANTRGVLMPMVDNTVGLDEAIAKFSVAQ